MRGVNAMPAAVRPPGRVGAQPFADVVAEHLDAVYRYLVYLTGDRAAAEDLAAETFERAFKSWRRFDPRRGAPRTWLCRIAHSAAVDWFRAEARRQRREETYTRDEALLEESVFSEGFSPELERLRPSARWWRCACCSSSTARARRACSGSARRLVRPGSVGLCSDWRRR
jgi:RNA polymerase sigma factor (sigma-70 family)